MRKPWWSSSLHTPRNSQSPAQWCGCCAGVWPGLCWAGLGWLVQFGGDDWAVICKAELPLCSVSRESSKLTAELCLCECVCVYVCVYALRLTDIDRVEIFISHTGLWRTEAVSFTRKRSYPKLLPCPYTADKQTKEMNLIHWMLMKLLLMRPIVSLISEANSTLDILHFITKSNQTFSHPKHTCVKQGHLSWIPFSGWTSKLKMNGEFLKPFDYIPFGYCGISPCHKLDTINQLISCLRRMFRCHVIWVNGIGVCSISRSLSRHKCVWYWGIYTQDFGGDY